MGVLSIVIARSAATKQSSGAEVDCFASLAMTKNGSFDGR